MRIMMMHKTNPRNEAGVPPSPELMARMGALLGEIAQAGVLLAGEGLRQSALGVRLHFSGGKRTITKGPFTPSNELIDRYLIVRVPSIEDAIEWATRFAGEGADAEIDVRPVTEAWDIGMMPRPADATETRFMIAHKADRASESATRPTAETRAAIAAVSGDTSGALLMAEALQPSSKSLRVRFSGAKHTVIDGPFAESKELIAGFVIFELPSKEDAIQYAIPFAAALNEDVEVDIRPMYEREELRLE